MSSYMVVQDALRAAAEEIVDAVEGWRRAYEDWQRAINLRDRLCEQMDRRVTNAAGGLSVARFEVTCRRRSFHDGEDAKAKARALRARPALQAAVAERDRVLAAADGNVVAARLVLAEASKTVVRFGSLGVGMVGLDPSELRRFARRPPIS